MQAAEQKSRDAGGGRRGNKSRGAKEAEHSRQRNNNGSGTKGPDTGGEQAAEQKSRRNKIAVEDCPDGPDRAKKSGEQHFLFSA